MFEKIPIASRLALDDGLLIDVFRRGEPLTRRPRSGRPPSLLFNVVAIASVRATEGLFYEYTSSYGRRSMSTTIQIDNEALLRNAIYSGFNLFAGAGFSLLAENANGARLPVGPQLKTEIVREFHVDGGPLSLSQVATILESTRAREFRDFLTDLPHERWARPIRQFRLASNASGLL
jgi:hypothetical protein